MKNSLVGIEKFIRPDDPVDPVDAVKAAIADLGRDEQERLQSGYVKFLQAPQELQQEIVRERMRHLVQLDAEAAKAFAEAPREPKTIAEVVAALCRSNARKAAQKAATSSEPLPVRGTRTERLQAAARANAEKAAARASSPATVRMTRGALKAYVAEEIVRQMHAAGIGGK